MAEPAPIDALGVTWRLLLTLFFVALNGFFVAAEFALVKVRQTRIEALAEQGSGQAKTAASILENLDRYLSSCQLGITIASLILGWLAEPAVASLVVAAFDAAGVGLDPRIAHGIAIAIALTFVTVLHVTLGEQAPKIYAIQNSEVVSLRLSWALKLFTTIFSPAIWALNGMSNALLRMVGIESGHEHDGVLSREELSAILLSSARAGTITPKQREFAENILNMMALEVRHILVPRIDVVYLSLRDELEVNLDKIRNSPHSRLPLCDDDLDTVVGIVHVRDALKAIAAEGEEDLHALSREAPIVTDTQPIGRLIREMQESQSHCAVVLDEHGTAIGLAFLEDALEEIVGPIHDEFDVVEAYANEGPGGSIEMNGEVALPEAAEILGLDPDLGSFDTIGGLGVAELGRLPTHDDAGGVGPYRATVVSVRRNRILRLRFTKT
ncbi:MAG: hemolysin family protein [Polyangiaceae bacterium]